MTAAISATTEAFARTTFTKVLLYVFSVLVVSFVVTGTANAQERITEIRIHGNHTTPDADVLQLSGLRVGDEASDARLEEARRQLEQSGRFEDVELRRRYLSISDPSQILVMVLIEEVTGISDDDLTPGPIKKIRASGMWLPVLSYADGYGFTYGARISFREPLGPRTRLSMPMTWGGERRIGADVERLIGGSSATGSPALRVIGGLAAYRRVNPHYELPDTRLEARVRAERGITSWLRAGGSMRTAQVTFGDPETANTLLTGPPAEPVLQAGSRERHDAFSADVTFDTRTDPSFPRNAIYASIGREQIRFPGAHANRWLTDLRGYVGVGGSLVLALRSQSKTTDRALPFSEQPLLGGGDSLRGYPGGFAANDNVAAISTELRIPLNSPATIGRFGLKAFVDWGKAWAHGTSARDTRWERGIGGGVYFGAGPLLVDVAVAGSRDGDVRGDFGLGVTF